MITFATSQAESDPLEVDNLNSMAVAAYFRSICRYQNIITLQHSFRDHLNTVPFQSVFC